MSIELPKSWQDLTQEQLRYICCLLGSGVELADVKYYCFIRWSGFEVVSRWGDDWIVAVRKGFFSRKELTISGETVACQAVRWLSWLDKVAEKPVRVEEYNGLVACDAMLFGLEFEKFLRLENLWQGYIYSRQQEPLCHMAHILYADKKERMWKKVPEVVRASVAIWFMSFKQMCYEEWPNLFRPGEGEHEEGEAIDVKAITNMQIRALTGGDITKEKEVLQMDVWRALTELDAKAHDAAEQRKEIAKLKHK